MCEGTEFKSNEGNGPDIFVRFKYGMCEEVMQRWMDTPQALREGTDANIGTVSVGTGSCRTSVERRKMNIKR